jgi:hypothetical protein
MSQAKKAKKAMFRTAQGFTFTMPVRDQAKPLNEIDETSVKDMWNTDLNPSPTLDPLTGVEPDIESLEELKQIAKDLGIKGYNFYKDAFKLKSKIEESSKVRQSFEDITHFIGKNSENYR